jgi:integrase
MLTNRPATSTWRPTPKPSGLLTSSAAGGRGTNGRKGCNGEQADRSARRGGIGRAFCRAALKWPDGFRPCHDLRVTGATNELLAGASKETLMVKLGHADFRTTQRYVNLAGVVFADEADALEARMNGGAVESSTDPVSPARISDDLPALGEAESLSD